MDDVVRIYSNSGVGGGETLTGIMKLGRMFRCISFFSCGHPEGSRRLSPRTAIGGIQMGNVEVGRPPRFSSAVQMATYLSGSGRV